MAVGYVCCTQVDTPLLTLSEASLGPPYTLHCIVYSGEHAVLATRICG